MKISSEMVGLELKEYSTRITWRQTTNYAAAIGDMNPIFVDDNRADGIIAPPMFAVALSWPIIQNLEAFLDLPGFTQLSHTMVHYTEYLEYHQPIQPESQIFIKGEIAAISPHKSGTHIIFRFLARDIQGNLIYTEYIGGLLRGVECQGEGLVKNYVPALADKTAADKPIWSSDIKISKESPYIYDGCTNIVFPIHTSPKFASQVGLPGIILQGTATMAYAVRELTNREAAGNAASLENVSCRFTGMVLPDSTISVQLMDRKKTPEGKTNLFFKVLNEQGHQALSRGFMTIKNA